MDGSLFGRAALERLLAAATFRFSQSTAGPEPSMHWKCGCMASECPEHTYRLLACKEHRHLLSDPQRGETSEPKAG